MKSSVMESVICWRPGFSSVQDRVYLGSLDGLVKDCVFVAWGDVGRKVQGEK